MSLLFGYASDLELVEENVDVDGNKIFGLPDPTEDSEPVTKGYADKHYLGGGQVDPQGPRGPTGPRGPIGLTGSQVPQGPKGDKGDAGSQGPQGLKGDKGDVSPQGQKGDKGDPGLSGPRGLQGVQGLTGPRGRKGDKGYKGDKGDTGAGFTASGVTMSGNIDMSTNKVTNLATPTANADVATKKYVDDREFKFKDGTTTTSDVHLKTSASGSEFYDDVTFKAKARCKNLNILSSSDEIVNKNSLETGHFVGIQSLTPTLQGILSAPTRKELLIMKGKQHHNLQASFFER